jgi:hypothetical protein
MENDKMGETCSMFGRTIDEKGKSIEAGKSQAEAISKRA